MWSSLSPGEMGTGDWKEGGLQVGESRWTAVSECPSFAHVVTWSHCPDTVTSYIHLHTKGHQGGTVCLFAKCGISTLAPLPPWSLPWSLHLEGSSPPQSFHTSSNVSLWTTGWWLLGGGGRKGTKCNGKTTIKIKFLKKLLLFDLSTRLDLNHSSTTC